MDIEIEIARMRRAEKEELLAVRERWLKKRSHLVKKAAADKRRSTLEQKRKFLLELLDEAIRILEHPNAQSKWHDRGVKSGMLWTSYHMVPKTSVPARLCYNPHWKQKYGRAMLKGKLWLSFDDNPSSDLLAIWPCKDLTVEAFHQAREEIRVAWQLPRTHTKKDHQ